MRYDLKDKQIMSVVIDGRRRHVLRSQIENTMYIAKASYTDAVVNPTFYLYDVSECKAKKMYMHGEHTCFDSQEERDIYNANYHALRDRQIYRNKLLKKIESLSIKDLEKIVAIIDKGRA